MEESRNVNDKNSPRQAVIKIAFWNSPRGIFSGLHILISTEDNEINFLRFSKLIGINGNINIFFQTAGLIIVSSKFPFLFHFVDKIFYEMYYYRDIAARNSFFVLSYKFIRQLKATGTLHSAMSINSNQWKGNTCNIVHAGKRETVQE